MGPLNSRQPGRNVRVPNPTESGRASADEDVRFSLHVQGAFLRLNIMPAIRPALIIIHIIKCVS